MLELIIIAFYFAAIILIGTLSHQRRWRLADYLVAGRKYSLFFITGSLLATIIGGSATIGLAGLGFSRGLSGSWWLLVGSLGLIVLGFLFAKKVRDFGVYTLPEIIEKQYGKNVALAASILIVIAWIGVTAGQILAAGNILSTMGIGTPAIWMIGFTTIFVGYTMAGGQYALIRTDILDVIIIFGGIFTGLGVLLFKLGGLEAFATSLPADKFSFPLSASFGINDLISYILLVGLTYVVGPDIYSRLFCSKDSKTARISVFWAALFLIPFAFCITLLGMGAFALFPSISPEKAFPTLITGVLPPFIAGIVLAALVSAVMSTASATLMSASTIFSVDIIGFFKKSIPENKSFTLSRWGILIIGIASLALALVLKGVISALLFAYTIYTCGVILPVIAGFYKDRLKITSTAAMFSIIGGGLTGLVSKIWGSWISINWGIQHLDLLALGFSLLLLFLVSLIENQFKTHRKIFKSVK